MSVKTYIIKICNKFIYAINKLCLLTTPIEILELHHIEKDKIILDSSKTLYQCKIGSLLFDIIATRLDIAFPVSFLSRFNQWPEHQYYKVANRAFYYLFSMQDYYIHYREEGQKFFLFIYTNNAVFNNNILD